MKSFPSDGYSPEILFLGTGDAHFHNKHLSKAFSLPRCGKSPVLTVSVAWQSSTAIQLGAVVQFSARTAVSSGLYAKCTALRGAANQTAGLLC